MADETRAIAWLLSQANELEITIESLSWINDLFPGWSDISCSFQLKSRKIVAWGADPAPDRALCKAFSEATERGVFLCSLSDTTNGFASHINQHDAQRNAIRELQERDLFLCHFLTNMPFPPIMTKNLLNEVPLLAHALSLAKNLNVRLRYYALGIDGVLAVADGLENLHPWGIIIGTGYKEDYTQSAVMATIEAMRSVVSFIRSCQHGDIGQSLTLQEFLDLPSPTFLDHGKLALNVEYARSIYHLFPETSNNDQVTPKIQGLELESIEVETLRWPYTDGTRCPFYFARAKSQMAQPLFLGRPTYENINLARLIDFEQTLGRPNCINRLNNLPHPLN